MLSNMRVGSGGGASTQQAVNGSWKVKRASLYVRHLLSHAFSFGVDKREELLKLFSRENQQASPAEGREWEPTGGAKFCELTVQSSGKIAPACQLWKQVRPKQKSTRPLRQ